MQDSLSPRLRGVNRTFKNKVYKINKQDMLPTAPDSHPDFYWHVSASKFSYSGGSGGGGGSGEWTGIVAVVVVGVVRYSGGGGGIVSGTVWWLWWQ